VTIEAAEAALAQTSDLKTRTISGIVMMAAALLWFGGIPFLIALLVLGGLVFYEFSNLVDGFAKTTIGRLCWKMFGLLYVSTAVWSLWLLRKPDGYEGFVSALTVLAIVWAVDIGAYFTGRTFGGRKIWPAISPSKTWSGLFGGMVGATLVLAFAAVKALEIGLNVPILVICGFMGALIAIIAQSGDFFESWMKRKAGVKDSGSLIPGHGGVFDRLDGLLPVVIILNLAGMLARSFLAG
jgi:phosphatidate cytidylyltransferase